MPEQCWMCARFLFFQPTCAIRGSSTTSLIPFQAPKLNKQSHPENKMNTKKFKLYLALFNSSVVGRYEVHIAKKFNSKRKLPFFHLFTSHGKFAKQKKSK
ncbi:hypothetical protein ACKWTF_003176 [Chironomus riparius]